MVKLNRLAEMEKELARRPSWARPRSSQPAGGDPRPARAAGLARRSRAFSTPVDYDVPPLITPLAQPSGKTCWATVTTMLLSWRDQMSYGIGGAMGQIGAQWKALFDADQALPFSDHDVFLAAAGLVAEAPQSFTVKGWENLLRSYGPIWVTTDEALGYGTRFHARLVIGIHGDGSAAGTFLDLIDPDGGKRRRERVSDFLAKYEEVVRELKDVMIQIVHLPADARSKGLALPSGPQSAKRPSEDDLELTPDEIADAEADDLQRAQAYPIRAFSKPLTAKDARWAPDALSPDYRHLNEPGVSQAFSFTAEDLEELVERNGFDVSEGRAGVIFGLRGCQLVGPSAGFSRSLELSEDVPDHVGNHCVIGVWRRSDGMLVGFDASTVPNWKQMERQRRGLSRANLLPTGAYAYDVGTHRPTSNRPQPGAFRQADSVVVLRSLDDLVYTINDTWERGFIADNIHAGRLRLRGVDFSSAGCQTVPGGYDESNTRPLDDHPWARFRRALGLDNDEPTRDNGTRFIYVLLTGREARLVGRGGDTAQLTRLRFGSQGASVEALQLALKGAGLYQGRIDGDMGKNTTWGLIQWQKRNDGGSADGILTPATGRRLGFDIVARQSLQQGIAYGLGVRPWSVFFPFPKGTKYEVDGPLGYNGKGVVIERTQTLLSFQLDMPAYEFAGIKVPKANAVISVTYKKEGDGNFAKVNVNGTDYDDSNVTIKSGKTRRTIIPSRAIPGMNLEKISVAPDGKDEVDVDVRINGRDVDFDLDKI